LSDLPLLSEIKDFNQMNPDLFAELEKDNTLQESNEHGSDVIYTGKEDSIDKDEVIPDSIDEESIIFIDNEKVVPFTH